MTHWQSDWSTRGPNERQLIIGNKAQKIFFWICSKYFLEFEALFTFISFLFKSINQINQSVYLFISVCLSFCLSTCLSFLACCLCLSHFSFLFFFLCLFLMHLPFPVYKPWWLSIRNERTEREKTEQSFELILTWFGLLFGEYFSIQVILTKWLSKHYINVISHMQEFFVKLIILLRVQIFRLQASDTAIRSKDMAVNITHWYMIKSTICFAWDHMP